MSLAVIAGLGAAPAAARSSAPYPTAEEKSKIDALIVYYAKRYNVPVALARKVVQTESEYRPLARNGPYWGLMQIRYDTAKGMGYKGPPSGLLDAETNLAFGIAYLSNSLTAAKGNISRGHMLYRTGYYYEAKRRRVLDEMITVNNFTPIGQAPTVLAMVESASDTGGLWSGDDDASSAGAKPTDAFAAVLAPTPRPKPDEDQPAVAAPTVVQASIASVETAKPMATAAKAEAPAVVAAAPPVAKELAVAKPQVVYASVLPFSRSTGLTAPASTAPAVLAAAIEPPVMSPVADPTAPIPRPKPGALASADAETVDASAAEVAVAAADMPVPRPRPAVAVESGIAMSIAPKAAAPAAEAEAAQVVVAQSSVPVPRSRPVETGALQ